MWWCLNNRKWECNMQLIKTDSLSIELTEEQATDLYNFIKALEFCKIDKEGNVHIKFRKSVVIEAEDHIINYSKDGMIIDKANMIHLNPEPVNAQGVQTLAILEKQLEHKE